MYKGRVDVSGVKLGNGVYPSVSDKNGVTFRMSGAVAVARYNGMLFLIGIIPGNGTGYKINSRVLSVK